MEHTKRNKRTNKEIEVIELETEKKIKAVDQLISLQAQVNELKARLAENEEADKNCPLCMLPMVYPLVHANCGQFLACTNCVIQLAASPFRCPTCGVEEVHERFKWLNEKYVREKYNRLNHALVEPSDVRWMDTLFELIELRHRNWRDFAITFSVPCVSSDTEYNRQCVFHLRRMVSNFLLAAKDALDEKKKDQSSAIQKELRADSWIKEFIFHVSEGVARTTGDLVGLTDDCYIRVRVIDRDQFNLNPNHYFYQLNIGIQNKY